MDFEPSLQPPLHIPVAFGTVRAKKKLPLPSSAEEEELSRCFLCKGLVEVEILQISVRILLPFVRSFLLRVFFLKPEHKLTVV